MATVVSPPLTTFKELYTSAPHDEPTIRRLMSPFDVDVLAAPAMDSTELIAALSTMGKEGRCVSLLIPEEKADGSFVIRTAHAPALCPTVLDVVQHEWMGRNFIGRGELYNNETEIFEWEEDDLRIAGAAYFVKTPEEVDTFFQNNPGENFMGPWAVGDAHTNQIRVRHSTFVPPRYIASHLDTEFTPREAFQRFSPLIRLEDAQTRAALQPLHNWLLAMVTRSVLNTAPPVFRTPMHAMNATPLRRHRSTIIYNYFPSLDPTRVHRHESMLLATQIGKVAQEMQESRRETREFHAKKEADKTPSQRWSIISHLHNIAHVDNDTQLPPIWEELANAKARDYRQIIQEAVNRMVTFLPSVSQDLIFTIDQNIVTLVQNLAFPMQNLDLLSTGFQPFVVGQANSKASKQLAAKTLLSDIVARSNVQLSLNEAAELTSLLAQDQLVTTHIEGLNLVQRFYVLAAVFLGTEHSAVRHLKSFFDQYKSATLTTLEHVQPRMLGYTNMLPAVIIRWLQLNWADWLNEQWNSENLVTCENFALLFRRIRRGEHQWEVSLPLEYHQVLQKLLAPPIPAMMHPDNIGGRGGGGIAPGGGGGIAPGGGGGIAPGRGGGIAPGGNGNTPGGGNGNQQVVNSTYNDAFAQYRDFRAEGRQIPIRHIRANANNVVPKSPRDENVEMCIAYHVLGRCQSNCRRIVDHVQHTAEEDAPLMAFCTEHWHA